MAQTPNYKRHVDLVDRMASTLGLDLEDAMARGALRIDMLGDVVLRCTGCADPGGCDRWLSAQHQLADSTPDMCRNGDFFDQKKNGGRT